MVDNLVRTFSYSSDGTYYGYFGTYYTLSDFNEDIALYNSLLAEEQALARTMDPDVLVSQQFDSAEAYANTNMNLMQAYVQLIADSTLNLAIPITENPISGVDFESTPVSTDFAGMPIPLTYEIDTLKGLLTTADEASKLPFAALGDMESAEPLDFKAVTIPDFIIEPNIIEKPKVNHDISSPDKPSVNDIAIPTALALPEMSDFDLGDFPEIENIVPVERITTAAMTWNVATPDIDTYDLTEPQAMVFNEPAYDGGIKVELVEKLLSMLDVDVPVLLGMGTNVRMFLETILDNTTTAPEILTVAAEKVATERSLATDSSTLARETAAEDATTAAESANTSALTVKTTVIEAAALVATDAKNAVSLAVIAAKEAADAAADGTYEEDAEAIFPTTPAIDDREDGLAERLDDSLKYVGNSESPLRTDSVDGFNETVIKGYVPGDIEEHDPAIQYFIDNRQADETYGRTGLSPAVEEALFNRGVERERLVNEAAYADIVSKFSIGWELPTGAYSGAIFEMQREILKNTVQLSREITIAQAELEQKNVHFVVDQSQKHRELDQAEYALLQKEILSAIEQSQKSRGLVLTAAELEQKKRHFAIENVQRIRDMERADADLNAHLNQDNTHFSATLNQEHKHFNKELNQTNTHFNVEIDQKWSQFNADINQRSVQFNADINQKNNQFYADISQRDVQFNATLNQKVIQFYADLDQGEAQFNAGIDQKTVQFNADINQKNRQFAVEQTQRSREIEITEYEIKVKQLQFTVDQAKEVESLMMNFFHKQADRSLTAAKAVSDNGIDVLNALIGKYNAEVGLYKAEAFALQTWGNFEANKIAIYKAELEGTEIESRIQSLHIDAYTQKVKIFETIASIHNIEMQSVKILSDLERLKLDIFKTEGEIYNDKIEAERLKISIYKEETEVEKVRLSVLVENLRVKEMMVAVSRQNLEAQDIKSRNMIEQNRLRMDAYKMQVEQINSSIQVELKNSDISVKEFNASVDAYTAKISGIGVQHDLKMKELDSEIQVAKFNLEKAVSDSEMTTKGYVSLKELELKANEGVMNVAAQVAASALNSINVSASISDSESKSIGYSYSGSTSM